MGPVGRRHPGQGEGDEVARLEREGRAGRTPPARARAARAAWGRCGSADGRWPVRAWIASSPNRSRSASRLAPWPGCRGRSARRRRARRADRRGRPTGTARSARSPGRPPASPMPPAAHAPDQVGERRERRRPPRPAVLLRPARPRRAGRVGAAGLEESSAVEVERRGPGARRPDVDRDEQPRPGPRRHLQPAHQLVGRDLVPLEA